MRSGFNNQNVYNCMGGVIPLSSSPIVTLCGSTKFKDLFLKVAQDFTLNGWIVLMPGVFGHADGFEWTDEQKKNLDKLHLEKIRMSNAIFVLNYEGYIGESTKKEIEYAKLIGIPIYTYE